MNESDRHAPIPGEGDDCPDCDCAGSGGGDHTVNEPAETANSRVQSWVDRWLDDTSPWNEAVSGDDRHSVDGAVSDTSFETSLAGDGQRIADLAFLHALLEVVHRPRPDVVAQRVRRVMGVILAEQTADVTKSLAAEVDSEKLARAPRRSAAAVLPTWVWPLFSTAAVLLVAAGIYWNSGSQANARAAILRASADAARLADREYHATADFQNPSGKFTRTESTLWVRGGEKFVLEHPWMGGHVTIGNNGHCAWFVPLLGLPSQADDPRQSVWWAHKAGWALPDLTVRGLIESLIEDFDLELLPDEALPEHPGMQCRH
ncbi:MAG: hypothetical protein AB7U73_09275, partial [Pirellulales bacterium]